MLVASVLTVAPLVCADVSVVHVAAELDLPVDLVEEEVPLGGLSGITYDPGCDLFYVVSDDRGHIGPPRVYSLRLSVDPPGVEPIEVIELRDRDGGPLGDGTFDAEAAAIAPDGVLWVSTEGVPHEDVPPRILGFRLDGTLVEEIAVPAAYLPTEGAGVRSNHGFEGVDITPDGSRLVAAVETALEQDGPQATLEHGTTVRLLILDLTGGGRVEKAYRVEPVPDEPRPPTAHRSIGVSDVLALDRDRLLVMERSFSAGVGNRVRIFLADLTTGDDVTGWAALTGEVAPVKKTLVADIRDLGVDPDNLEGLSFGPALPDGRAALVAIADNNFQPEVQSNQLLVFAVTGVASPTAARIPASVNGIQGVAHVSPLVGRCVADVSGVVTAVLGQRRGQAFWIQRAPADDDPATSDGLFVTSVDGLPQVEVGDELRLTGRVREPSWGMELPVTRLVADGLEITARGRDLPPPVVMGVGGRPIPSPNIDDDGLTRFDPATDAVDFYESLEGMRVRVEDPVVVGPTSKHGEIVVLGDRGAGVGPRTGNGGVVLLPDNAHPERVIIDDRLMPNPPAVAVGEGLTEPVDGVLHYSYGSFKLLNTDPLRVRPAMPAEAASTDLAQDGGHATVATFNVENLHRASHENKFAGLADIIVRRLGSPTVVALQEIQDDSGPLDDGTASAGQTLGRLSASIEASGGPRYRWVQVDPENNADGGRPGANIRVALLFDPERASLVPEADSILAANPARLGVEDPVFADSRKPLAVELEIDGERVSFIVCHLRSKGGDDPLFGRRQPPVRSSELQRVPQAVFIRSSIDRRLASDPSARIVLLGDLNDFEFSDAVGALGAEPMVNLMDRLPVSERSTYVYQGNSQTLDHIIVSPALSEGAEIEVVHLNAHRPVAERASDHDPVVARISVR